MPSKPPIEESAFVRGNHRGWYAVTIHANSATKMHARTSDARVHCANSALYAANSRAFRGLQLSGVAWPAEDAYKTRAHMLVKLAIWLLVVPATALLMEFWAALLHGRFWHGMLWNMHRSHHRPRHGHWEANDWLSLLHAPIAIAMILYGCRAEPGVLREFVFAVGIGMTVFGLAYLLVHDGMVHGRLPMQWLLKYSYFKRVQACHELHHNLRYRGVPYGFFLGKLELHFLAKDSRQAERRSADNLE
jgi:beta-carotene 3-hydroxylase